MFYIKNNNCVNDYYLDENNISYYSCNDSNFNSIENCKECNEKYSCYLCKDNYTFINGNKSKYYEISELGEKYIVDPNDESNYIKCSDFINNCSLCNNSICFNCYEGYIFINDDFNNCLLKSSLDLTYYYSNDEKTYYSCENEKYKSNPEWLKIILETTLINSEKKIIDSTIIITNSKSVIVNSTILITNQKTTITNSTTYITNLKTLLTNSTKIITSPIILTTNTTKLMTVSTTDITKKNTLINNSTILITNSSALINNSTILINNLTTIITNPNSILTNSTTVKTVPIILINNPTTIKSNPKSMVINSTTLISDSKELISNSVTLISNTKTIITNPITITTNSTSLVSNQKISIINPVSIISNSTIVSNPKTSITNSTELITNIKTEIINPKTIITTSIKTTKIEDNCAAEFPFNKITIILLQIKLKDHQLYLYILIDSCVQNDFSLTIKINKYIQKSLRNLQQETKKEMEINISPLNYTKSNSYGGLYKFIPENSFKENLISEGEKARIVVLNIISNKNKNEYSIEMGNNSDYLDTAKMEEKIQNKQAVDIGLIKNVGIYHLESISQGCTFEIFTYETIKSSNRTINLECQEINSHKNKSIKCYIYKNIRRIDCNLDEDINNNCTLKNYIEFENDELFSIIINEQKIFPITCSSEKNISSIIGSSSGSKLSKTLIILIILAPIILAIIVVSFIFIYRKYKNNNIINSNKSKIDTSSDTAAEILD